MADIYDDFAEMSRELLAPTSEDGFGQGEIALVRYVDGPAPANPWDPPAAQEREVTILNGAARGVGKEMVGTPIENGGQIIASDLVVIAAPWGGEYEPADVLQIDGKPVTVLSVKNIPEAGTVCLVQFVARR